MRDATSPSYFRPIVAALSGMWMALRWPAAEYGGAALTAMRLVVGSAMTAAIVVALSELRRRDYAAHGDWMTRAYALGSGAGTQFFAFIPWLLLPSIRTVTLHAALHALGWIINIVVAEAVVRRRARRRRLIDSGSAGGQTSSFREGFADGSIDRAHGDVG